MRVFDEIPPILRAALDKRTRLRQTSCPESVAISSHVATNQTLASVDLYWLPLGAGAKIPIVRWNGRIFEALVALHERRPRCDLFHSALAVRLGSDRFVIEMAPVWESSSVDRGVVREGPVGTPYLGRFRGFRYEVRCWRNGTISDARDAVESPRHIDTDVTRTQLLVNSVAQFPNATWGRDELATGEMWNSNSLVSWLLARSHHDTEVVRPPAHGRAPGWHAGLQAAARANAGASREDEGTWRPSSWSLPSRALNGQRER